MAKVMKQQGSLRRSWALVQSVSALWFHTYANPRSHSHAFKERK